MVPEVQQRGRRVIEKWIGLLIVGCVVSSVFSVAVSSILLGAAYFLVAIRAIKNKSLGLQSPGFGIPLLVFLGTVAVSTLASEDPAWSLPYLARVLKLCFVFPLFTFLDRRGIEWTLKGLLAAMAASAIYGLVQYFWFLDVDLLNRVSGFMSHWMTFSGQMMIGVVALTGWIVSTRRPEARDRLGPAFWGCLVVLGLLGTALLVTLTRSAWIGALLGVFLLLALRSLEVADGRTGTVGVGILSFAATFPRPCLRGVRSGGRHHSGSNRIAQAGSPRRPGSSLDRRRTSHDAPLVLPIPGRRP